MNQLSKGFDYSSIPKGIADFLRDKEVKMNTAVSNAYTEIGKHLKEAQEELSKHRYGCFEEWYTAIGLKKNQVYRLLQRYELIVANGNKRDLIEDLPISLVREITKPTAPPEAVKAVLNEDITTRKEYLELLKSLQQAQKQAETAKSSANHFEHLWQQAKNQPPKVVTNSVEVVPETIKRELEDLKFQNNNLRAGYQEARHQLEKFELRDTTDFDEIEAQKQRKKLQHEADVNVLQIRAKINRFLEDAAITTLMEGALSAADPITKQKIRESIEMLDSFTTQIKTALSGRIIGGVINE